MAKDDREWRRMTGEDTRIVEKSENSESGVLSWLISGRASAKILDFFVTYKDFDYSETDIAESAGVSKRTVLNEIPKCVEAGLITFTRRVGQAKMYKLNTNSSAAKHLQQLVYDIATTRIDKLKDGLETFLDKVPETDQKIIPDVNKESVIENKQNQ